MTQQVTLYHGDCLEILPTLGDGSVDAVVTDPPYGIGYASSRTTRMNGEQRKSNASFGPDDFDASWLPAAARLLKDGGALYIFTRWDVLNRWAEAIAFTGLLVRQCIIWDKSHWGMGDLRYFGSQVEHILFATKGVHKLLWGKRGGNLWNVWKGRVWSDGFANHPTQKPVELMQKICELSVPVTGIAIDPFMGSGTTGVACMKTGRNFIGIEIERKYYDIAEKRIREAQQQPLLFEG
jgi:DNA modification methylase